MRLWKHALTLVAAVAFAWPMAEATAQRGDRGGGDRGGGDRGGQRSADSNRGGRGGESRGRSFSGGQQRSFSGGQQPGDSQRRSAEAMQQRSRQRSQSIQRQPRTDPGQSEARSFYRGQDVQDMTRQLDRSNRDQARRGDWNRDRSGFDDVDRHDRERRDVRDRNRDDRQREGRDRDESWRDRDDRDRDYRDRGDRDRYGRDRDRYDRDPDNRWSRDRFGDDYWRYGGVRNDWLGWYGGYGMIPFRSGWYNNYLGGNWPIYSPYRYSRWANQPWYWWGWTPAAQLTDWVVFGWDRPRYWGYGPGGNIYYRDNYVYYDGRRTMPVDDYYQQIYDLAHSVPDISEQEAENMDWRPLGVFALTREGQSESRRALQLAINRDGVVTGTYFNRENDHVHPVSGMVDDRTQRAAWAFADGEHKDVVFETSVYNLTRQDSTMMVHFGPGADETEVWQLVRLEQPDSNATSRDTTQRPTSSRSLP